MTRNFGNYIIDFLRPAFSSYERFIKRLEMLHLLVHLGAIANFAYAIYFDWYLLKTPKPETWGGKWKYLTFLNMWFQLVYFSISFLNSIFGSHATDKKSASTLQRIRDYYFATIAFPIGQFVGIVFWTLFTIDRELIFPKRFDDFFPNHINHMMHTTVIPAQLLEMILLYHAYPSKKSGMATIFSFSMIYLGWTLVIAHVSGIWVYPIFEILTPPIRLVFMAVCSIVACFLYLFGEVMNNIFWSKVSNNVTNDGDAPSKTTYEPVKTSLRPIKGKKPKKAD